MQNSDRRKLPERREKQRYIVAVDIEWEIDSVSRRGRLTDINMNGCFILAGGQYSDGEIVSIYLPLSDGTRTRFLGEIRNHVPEIGFALCFLDLTDLQKQFIHNFAELHQSEQVKE
jgi:hypothetical protein